MSFMPNTINTPDAAPPVDRIELAVTAPRGATPQSWPANGCYNGGVCCFFAEDEN